MAIQPNSFNPVLAQKVSSFTGTGGLAAGNTFDGDGNDFLSPKTILNDTHDFANGITPITSNQQFVILNDPLGKNPKASKVLKNTSAGLSDIFSADFGANLFPSSSLTVTNNATLNTNLANTNNTALASTNNAATTLAAPATTIDTVNQVRQLVSDSVIRDISNFNPLIWQNPSFTNILIGTMDAQNKIYGGDGLFLPSIFNQYPLYPFITVPTLPFSGSVIPLPNQNGISTLPQAKVFPNTFVTDSPISPNANNTLQPFALSATQNVTSYPVQVALVSLLQKLLDAQQQSSNTFSQLLPANGVPPWTTT